MMATNTNTHTTQAKSNSTPNSLMDAHLKPDAKIYLLIGGPYILNGENHRYGHTAIRIVCSSYDLTYDFGRYGRVTGDLGTEGEGVLRVWKDFSKYISGENSLERKTTGYIYEVLKPQADRIKQFFEQKIQNAVKLSIANKVRAAYMTAYKLSENYHALSFNCTTISLDALRLVYPNFEESSSKFINPANILTGIERVALRVRGIPTRLFLPENLNDYLKTSPTVMHSAVNTYP